MDAATGNQPSATLSYSGEVDKVYNVDGVLTEAWWLNPHPADGLFSSTTDRIALQIWWDGDSEPAAPTFDALP
jgi:hypothetical protein